MIEQNGKPPEQGQEIKVEATMNLQTQTATFTEKSVNGLVMVQPKVITVPLQTILVMAAQATLAMMGVKPGAASTVKQGGLPNPGPRINP